ncbi:hypothetical protein [Sphingomonas sp. KR3-1]|uniref:hypothetical protein n=1 Tax=Sphingomonas sp. KR3-1 TaxID=3156611 RepID=UPI0032B399EA
MLSPAEARRHCARIAPWLLAALFALPGAAAAQGFTLPKECTKYGASGAEGDDPVVLIGDNFTKLYINASANLVSDKAPITWSTTISPFRGGMYGYSIFVTYTPFLTSDVFVSDPSDWGWYTQTLPQPGVTGGRETAIYDVYQVLIRDKAQKVPVPNAMVDFIPDFVGSSPLTIQADSNGVVTLYCVQQNFQGYNITVNDAAGNYLYDGSIPGTKSGFQAKATAAGSAVRLVSRSESAPSAWASYGPPNPAAPVPIAPGPGAPSRGVPK